MHAYVYIQFFISIYIFNKVFDVSGPFVVELFSGFFLVFLG